MYENDPFGEKNAWREIKKIGGEIKNNWVPDYIIIVSAHWQSKGRNQVEVGISSEADEENKLIYDFYNFPDYMYKEEFHTRGSRSIASRIVEELNNAGFEGLLKERGIDHGVWVPLKVAFLDYNMLEGKRHTEEGFLDLPHTRLIQVSMTADDSDFDAQYKLGAVLSKFRREMIWDEKTQRHLKGMIIASGMSVHNLRDLRSFSIPGKIMPYVVPFNTLLTKILLSSDDTLRDLKNLKVSNKALLYQAHPTLEHFLPMLVACGTIGDGKEPIKELYNSALASLGWAIYQFGEDYSK